MEQDHYNSRTINWGLLSRLQWCITADGFLCTQRSGLTNELGVRKESEIGLILLSGDENMCIVDTESKIQEEECWKVKYI